MSSSASPTLAIALRQATSYLGVEALSIVRREVDGTYALLFDTAASAPAAVIEAARRTDETDARLHRGSDVGLESGSVTVLVLADERHLLIARGQDSVSIEPLAETGALALTLMSSEGEAGTSYARLFQDLAADSVPLSDRLGSALERGAGLMGMDAAVMLCVDAEEWCVESIHDPSGIVDTERLLASGGLASLTFRASGAVGVHDVQGYRFPSPGSARAFLGSPIVSGRHGLGVLAFLAREPRMEPFPDSCRGLVETLARWAGVALAGRTAEQRLAEQSAALQTLIGASSHPVGLAEWIPGEGEHDDLELSLGNDAAIRMLGVGTGDRLSEALPPSSLRLWTSACRLAMSEETVQRFRADIVPPGEAEARRYAVTLALVSLPEPGSPARFTFQAEDMTGRRHIRDHLHVRESQLRAVLERTPVLLFEVDESGRFTLCEGRALALSGVRPEELLGASVFERYKSHPEAMQAMGRVLAGEAATWRFTLGGRTLDVWAEPSLSRTGETCGARGVAVDVTERLIAERIAEEVHEETVSDARHSADLISLLSHGLRMPLATVLGFADLLASEPDTDAPEAGGAITRAATEILETLDGFVDLTHLSALRTGVPRAVSTPGLEAAIAAAITDGAPTSEASVEVVQIQTPILLDLPLVRAVVRRMASLLTIGPLAVVAEVRDASLFIRMVGEGLASRLSTDSLDAAYVHHAMAALGAELAFGPDGSVGLGIPIQLVPLVVLDETTHTYEHTGDGVSLGAGTDSGHLALR